MNEDAEPWEGSEFADGHSEDDTPEGYEVETYRRDLLDRVFRSLSADALRGDGTLLRGDVNRTYLRRDLSIDECMAVEGQLVAAGIFIVDNEGDDADDSPQEPTVRSRIYLSEAEERELGRKIQLARKLPADTSNIASDYVQRVQREALLAQAKFVMTNVRYVERLAYARGTQNHLSQEDLQQEGLLGLLRATTLFDPERGFRFKTYATWWIEQYMRRAIADTDRTIRLPVHIHEKIARLRKSERKLSLQSGRTPNLETLSRAIGMSAEQILRLRWLTEITECCEGDAPTGDDTTILSQVQDFTPDPYEIALSNELQQRICEVLGTLSEREAEVVIKRFGLSMAEERTLESLGQEYSLTRERIRQIESKALRKMGQGQRGEKLSGFLDPSSDK